MAKFKKLEPMDVKEQLRLLKQLYGHHDMENQEKRPDGFPIAFNGHSETGDDTDVVPNKTC